MPWPGCTFGQSGSVRAVHRNHGGAGRGVANPQVPGAGATRDLQHLCGNDHPVAGGCGGRFHHAAVLHQHSGRGGGVRPARRRRCFPYLLVRGTPDGTAGRDHPDHPVVPGLVERVAALHHFPAEPAAEHVASGCHPGQRRTGLRIPVPVEDGRRAVDDYPGRPGVLVFQRYFVRGARGSCRQGVTIRVVLLGKPPRADALGGIQPAGAGVPSTRRRFHDPGSDLCWRPAHKTGAQSRKRRRVIGASTSGGTSTSTSGGTSTSTSGGTSTSTSGGTSASTGTGTSAST